MGVEVYGVDKMTFKIYADQKPSDAIWLYLNCQDGDRLQATIRIPVQVFVKNMRNMLTQLELKFLEGKPTEFIVSGNEDKNAAGLAPEANRM